MGHAHAISGRRRATCWSAAAFATTFARLAIAAAPTTSTTLLASRAVARL
jgi:hypothetical protein